MSRQLLAVMSVASILGMVGCADVERESYPEYVLRLQVECKDVGGELHIIKDRSMLNGKSALCILPGTKLEIPND